MSSIRQRIRRYELRVGRTMNLPPCQHPTPASSAVRQSSEPPELAQHSSCLPTPYTLVCDSNPVAEETQDVCVNTSCIHRTVDRCVYLYLLLITRKLVQRLHCVEDTPMDLTIEFLGDLLCDGIGITFRGRGAGTAVTCVVVSWSAVVDGRVLTFWH